MIKLQPKQAFTVPVNAESITPGAFAGKSAEEIANMPIMEGNRKRTLGELFAIQCEDEPAEANAENIKIQIDGDIHKVRRIGACMSAGEIIVNGDAGMHLGEEMKGGRITVAGNADSWAGSMMRGGTIEVKGCAGDYVGAAYRGGAEGMRDGTIIIHGDAGNEIGYAMRKGLIKAYGNAGQFAGIHMKDGTIFIGGNCDGRAGAEMRSGKIVICGYTDSVLPTFTIDSVRPKVKVDGEEIAGPFYMFTGDATEGGDGRLYISQSKNPHLKVYEKYL